MIVFLAAAAAGLAWEGYAFRERLQTEGKTLESIAATVAAKVNGDALDRLHGPADAASPEARAICAYLESARKHYRLSSGLYAVRAVRDEHGRLQAARWVLGVPETPRTPHVSRLRDLAPVFEHGQRAHTGLHDSADGPHISAYAPVRSSGGRVVAVLAVDRPSEDLAAARRLHRLLALAVAAALAGLALLGPRLLGGSSRPANRMVRLFSQSLALRIGLAGSASVLLAVGIVAAMDHREARRELAASLQERLLSTVRVAAPLLDVERHEAVVRTGDAGSQQFLELREQLRRIQAAAGLSSPMYTLRRDGELVRFVVMTNEVPFVGDPYELRPGVRRTFERGGAGAEGPYVDAHGTWISAWAPLLDAAGRVTAVLQADYEVGELLAALRQRAVRRLLFALAGIAVAFGAATLLARGIARPLRRLGEVTTDLQSRLMSSEPLTWPSSSTAEMQSLVSNFQSMVSALRSSFAQLQERTDELTCINAELRQEIAQRQRLEEQMRQAQKMEVLGSLASGIAHDFNNVLMAILGYTELALREVPPESRTAAKLHEVLAAVKRARDLIRQILTFSRQRKLERTPLELHAVLREALRLLYASMPGSVSIEQHIDEKAGVVLADPTQIHQVVMNLCVNAEHAMRERGGVLTVRLEARPAAADEPQASGPGGWVCLSVSDSGRGMTPETQQRIFDPFFTTKPEGEGTGLGLAVVRKIVTEHGGRIRVSSAPGAGTTFTIELPRLGDGPAAAVLPGG